MNNEKGAQRAQVFGDNVDAILADKIVEHTKKSSGKTARSPKAASRPAKAESSQPTDFIYKTPEHRNRVKGLRKYGVAALALLAVLGILSYFLNKFRND